MTTETRSQIFRNAHQEAKALEFTAARDNMLKTRQILNDARSKSDREKASAAHKAANALYEKAEDFRGMSYRQRFAICLKREYARVKREEKVAAVASEGGFATVRQVNYLRDLGYRGDMSKLTKKEASQKIDSYTRISRDDNDDFRSERMSWLGTF